ncbi:hypothetical protein P0136_13225 [Lentisphaerota bacterium ZTH]|nr:hypothetical protein JYG24_09260 [Lentisphaerota bacterium]WET06320.1 hypothetical protein P0136_13225 [Lentisphaerota bacterium ZTH]
MKRAFLILVVSRVMLPAAVMLLLGAGGYVWTYGKMRSYHKKFLTLSIELFKPGIYQAVFCKEFTPEYGIALCLEPENSARVNPELLKKIRARFFLFDENGKQVCKERFKVNSTFKPFDIGKNLPCQFITRDLFPTGKYLFKLRIGQENAGNFSVPCKITAYPVYEVLPLLKICFMLLVAVSSAILLGVVVVVIVAMQRSGKNIC